jgi:hypothetical protein
MSKRTRRQQRKEAGVTWRQERLRGLQTKSGDHYIRFTPNFGFSIPWSKSPRGYRRRIRYARHHGLQMVEWRTCRWFVSKQILGKSTVNGELYTNGG